MSDIVLPKIIKIC